MTLLLCSILSCTNNTGNISGMDYVIFQSVESNRFSDHTPTKLNHSEVELIETIIKTELKEIIEFHKIQTERIYSNSNKSDLENHIKFVRQYLPFRNNRNEKIVFIQFICNPDDKYERYKNEWETKPVGNIIDGGSCYFNFIVDLTNNSLIDVSINSVG
ncbi:hypothetical protein [Winogradskyella tangerina]|uniref:hypothetical protein n=1 Tax=Winogradskyella tangerina TaxID=2023240 RepID=UPI00130076B2|nr:hypothetical protein [Winogradskyella tangerina]